MSALVELMDRWLEKHHGKPRPSQEDLITFIEMIQAEKAQEESRPLTHFQVVMAEKRRREEEETLLDSFREHATIDWKYARKHRYLIHS